MDFKEGMENRYFSTTPAGLRVVSSQAMVSRMRSILRALFLIFITYYVTLLLIRLIVGDPERESHESIRPAKASAHPQQQPHAPPPTMYVLQPIYITTTTKKEKKKEKRREKKRSQKKRIVVIRRNKCRDLGAEELVRPSTIRISLRDDDGDDDYGESECD
jgi:hypothetical protein